MMGTLRVMLGDDHEVLRAGLRRLLESAGFDVVAEAASGEQAYGLYCEYMPDVLVMDLSMPGQGGLEALRRIIGRHSGARVVVYTMHEGRAFAEQALRSGARGYVTKSSPAEDLLDAVNCVAEGEVFISAVVAQQIAARVASGSDDPATRLSPREFEIFRMLAQGRDLDSIAQALKISQKTVANHQTLIRQKLNAANAVDIVRLALSHGLIEPPE